MKTKMTLLAALLGALVMFGGAGTASAADRNDCYRSIQRQEIRVDRAIDQHGFRSRQAERERYELDRLRERCRRDHRWR
jgi:hypothetical protein